MQLSASVRMLKGNHTNSSKHKPASDISAPVEHEVDHLLADGVVAAGVVVGGVLLARDELLWVEQLAVGARADLIDDGGLQVDEDSAGDVLAGAGLGEEGVEGIVATADGLVRRHLAVRLNAVLQAEQLPAGVADLAASLANVDGDHFTLQTHVFNRSYSLATHHIEDEFVHAHSKPAVG